MAPGAPKPSKLLLQHPVELPPGVTSLPPVSRSIGLPREAPPPTSPPPACGATACAKLPAGEAGGRGGIGGRLGLRTAESSKKLLTVSSVREKKRVKDSTQGLSTQ